MVLMRTSARPSSQPNHDSRPPQLRRETPAITKATTVTATAYAASSPTRTKASTGIIPSILEPADDRPATLSPLRFSMTTAKPTTTKAPSRFRLPDPPEREPEDMTSFDRLAENGNAYLLKQHLLARQPGGADNIIVSGEHYLLAEPTPNLEGSRYPDLLVAFDADPAAYRDTNGYVIAEQGKPPDFALEIASRTTGHVDTGQKRTDYADLGILEYWRFDATGEFHGTKLAGEQLVDGSYVAVQIEELPDGDLQGYSTVLDLHLRWERGELVFYDPRTGKRIVTLEDERARADAEHEARVAAEARADDEHEARMAAEARIRELEQRLQQQDS